jgi:hypothetical protein
MILALQQNPKLDAIPNNSNKLVNSVVCDISMDLRFLTGLIHE